MQIQLSMPLPSEQYIAEHILNLKEPDEQIVFTENEDEDHSTPYWPLVINSKHNKLLVKSNILFEKYYSDFYSCKMNDIKEWLKPFLNMPNISAEQIVVKGIGLHYDLVTKEKPIDYITSLSGDKKSFNLIHYSNCSETLYFCDYLSYVTADDIASFDHLKSKKVLRLEYVITDIIDKFGYKVTAAHLLNETFIKNVIDDSVKAFLKLSCFKPFGVYEYPNSIRKSIELDVCKKEQKLINEVAEKLIATAYRKKLTL